MANKKGKGSKNLGKKIQPAAEVRSGNPAPINSQVRRALVDILEEISDGSSKDMPEKGVSIRDFAIQTMYKAMKAKDKNGPTTVAIRAAELVLGYTDHKPRIGENASEGSGDFHIYIGGISVNNGSAVSPPAIESH